MQPSAIAALIAAEARRPGESHDADEERSGVQRDLELMIGEIITGKDRKQRRGRRQGRTEHRVPVEPHASLVAANRRRRATLAINLRVYCVSGELSCALFKMRLTRTGELSDLLVQMIWIG